MRYVLNWYSNSGLLIGISYHKWYLGAIFKTITLYFKLKQDNSEIIDLKEGITYYSDGTIRIKKSIRNK